MDREGIDLVARAVVSGRRGFGVRIDAVADAISGMMRNRLAAAGAGGRSMPRARVRAVVVAPRLLNALLERTAKQLGSSVLTQGADGGTEPR